MRLLSIVLTVVLLTSVSGCAVTKGGVIVDCAKDVASSDIVGQVDAVIADSTYVEKIAALVEKYGHCLIHSAVAQVVAKYKGSADAKAASDVVAAVKVEHGEAWLAANP
jgi:hypothetical protein